MSIITFRNMQTGTIHSFSQSFSVGRSTEKCEVVILLPQVSRIHCVVKKHRGDWTIMDRSLNGTALNCLPMRQGVETILVTGDLVTVGGFDFEVAIKEGSGSELTSLESCVMQVAAD